MGILQLIAAVIIIAFPIASVWQMAEDMNKKPEPPKGNWWDDVHVQD